VAEFAAQPLLGSFPRGHCFLEHSTAMLGEAIEAHLAFPGAHRNPSVLARRCQTAGEGLFRGSRLAGKIAVGDLTSFGDGLQDAELG